MLASPVLILQHSSCSSCWAPSHAPSTQGASKVLPAPAASLRAAAQPRSRQHTTPQPSPVSAAVPVPVPAAVSIFVFLLPSLSVLHSNGAWHGAQPGEPQPRKCEMMPRSRGLLSRGMHSSKLPTPRDAVQIQARAQGAIMLERNSRLQAPALTRSSLLDRWCPSRSRSRDLCLESFLSSPIFDEHC